MLRRPFKQRAPCLRARSIAGALGGQWHGPKAVHTNNSIRPNFGVMLAMVTRTRTGHMPGPTLEKLGQFCG